MLLGSGQDSVHSSLPVSTLSVSCEADVCALHQPAALLSHFRFTRPRGDTSKCPQNRKRKQSPVYSLLGGHALSASSTEDLSSCKAALSIPFPLLVLVLAHSLGVSSGLGGGISPPLLAPGYLTTPPAMPKPSARMHARLCK